MPSDVARADTRIGWVGFHVEGVAALRAVLARGFPIAAVVTLEASARAALSGSADYQPVCREYGVPLYFVHDINDHRARALLRQLALDVVFVVGWTQLVHADVLRLARIGMIGAHASLLPQLRGRAPVNWALIRGMPQTGNSLMWLAEGADRGDIIDQTVIPVSRYDTCATVYDKVAESNTQMILRVLPALMRGERPGRPQPPSTEAALPRRQPKDGIVDWSRSSREVYDFIRALTKPYPGAMSWLDSRCYRIWEAALLPGSTAGRTPGQIAGAVVSPRADACGVVVACLTGTVMLLEVEDDRGRVLSGRALSDQPWSGKQWVTPHG